MNDALLITATGTGEGSVTLLGIPPRPTLACSAKSRKFALPWSPPADPGKTKSRQNPRPAHRTGGVLCSKTGTDQADRWRVQDDGRIMVQPRACR